MANRWLQSFATADPALKPDAKPWRMDKFEIQKYKQAAVQIWFNLCINAKGRESYRAVLKPVPINLARSKTYIWTPRSTFYNERKLSCTLKWLWTKLLALFLVLLYIEQFWNQFQSTQDGQKHISGHQEQPSMMQGGWVTPWSGSGPCCWHCCWCWCT